MNLRDINFGDVDAKNEILKQKRGSESTFFEAFSIPERISIESFLSGNTYIILGLKGTGKTALLRYINDICQKNGAQSELVLFKSHISEEDRQNLSKSAGYEVVTTSEVPIFIQDFKEAWKWLIYQRIALQLKISGNSSDSANKLMDITGVREEKIHYSLGSLLSKMKSGSIKLSAAGVGVALEVGVDLASKAESKTASISDLNRICSDLTSSIEYSTPIYILFDELELFHQTAEQFDRDRRILRDLIYAISQINAASADLKRSIYLITSLRTEVLHSVLELGHEIGRDIDDFGVRLDWSEGKDSPEHSLLKLIRKKISISANIPEASVWETFFPEKINNQPFYKFILNSSYYRPRDIVRLLRVARDFRPSDARFTTEHFDRSSKEFSKQTWLEITEELLAIYSNVQIEALQRFFLGFNTSFFKVDLEERLRKRYKSDQVIQSLFADNNITKVLDDLFRIGVVGNDFIVKSAHGRSLRRHRWIFRGDTTLNDSERMAIHKSLWKHLSLVVGVSR